MTRDQFEQRCKKEFKQREPDAYRQYKSSFRASGVLSCCGCILLFLGVIGIFTGSPALLGCLLIGIIPGVLAGISINKYNIISEKLDERKRKYYENDEYLRYPVDYPYSFLYEGEIYPFRDIRPAGYQPAGYQPAGYGGPVNPVPPEQMLIKQNTKSIGTEANDEINKQYQELRDFTRSYFTENTSENKSENTDLNETVSTTASVNSDAQNQTPVMAQSQTGFTQTPRPVQPQTGFAQPQPMQPQTAQVQGTWQAKPVVAQMASTTEQIVCISCKQQLTIPLSMESVMVTCPSCKNSFLYTPGK